MHGIFGHGFIFTFNFWNLFLPNVIFTLVWQYTYTQNKCFCFSTRSVQKLIETVKTRHQISLVVSALEVGFLDLIKDLNGNHVVQRCLQCLSNDDNKVYSQGSSIHKAHWACHCCLYSCVWWGCFDTVVLISSYLLLMYCFYKSANLTFTFLLIMTLISVLTMHGQF